MKLPPSIKRIVSSEQHGMHATPWSDGWLGDVLYNDCDWDYAAWLNERNAAVCCSSPWHDWQ